MCVMCDTYTLRGYEVIEKKVGKHGTGGHVYLPRAWVGATVKIVRTTPPVKED